MARKKEHSRVELTYEDKKKILAKSNVKCAHCGRGIDIHNGLTVEHVIPLAKGGTNFLRNLVALCDSCNQEKGDKIVFPTEYYSYLIEYYNKRLAEEQMKYYIGTSWLTFNNLTPDEKKVLRVPCEINSMQHISKRGKNKYTNRLYNN